ncbi:MAG: ribosome silencing factor [Pseudomonadota bacterium]
MRSAHEGSQGGTPLLHVTQPEAAAGALKDQIVGWLDDAKAEDVVEIDLAGKSAVADFMLIVSGRSDRHVNAIAEQVERKLKDTGHGSVRTEGKQSCDWVLVDVGDVIVHIFRPEVREFYNLEKMWSSDRPTDDVTH